VTADAPPAGGAGSATGRSTSLLVVALVALVIGVAIRVALLPTDGLRGDIDQFVLWVHGIAVNGLPVAYDRDLAFPPVMAYLWGLLAAIQPAFQTVTDGSDPAIRILMKLPASLADIGLAALVAYGLRATPRWAVAGFAAMLLYPAVIDISAWWGQYESIYLLSALAAALFAINGRNGWGAAFLAVSIMTKPQALPFLVPFAAWFWATGGPRGFLRAALIGGAVVVVLWLPFLAAGGPVDYLHNLAQYQGGVFSILSLRAWNLWWLVQSVLAGGSFVADDVAFLGPVTLRWIGYAVVGVLELTVALAVFRDPRPRTLILGLAAATLVAFCFLTSMHERYAYGALVFLMLLIPERRVRWLAIAFGLVFTLNLLAAAPPTETIGKLLPVGGSLGIVGSLAMLAITGACLWLMSDGAPGRSAQGRERATAPTEPGEDRDKQERELLE
jgi:Gpi18-like mannosyltransferase